MKAFLAAAVAAAAFATPASATTSVACHPVDVHVSGFAVTSLSESGIGCHYAREVATHFLRNRLHGYDCTTHVSGRIVRAHCVQLANSSYTASFSYHVS